VLCREPNALQHGVDAGFLVHSVGPVALCDQGTAISAVEVAPAANSRRTEWYIGCCEL
jgi:hypothetical protein